MMNMDPRRYAWDQDSPWAIYAAGRWFGSRDDPAWQDRARIHDIFQLPDISFIGVIQ